MSKNFNSGHRERLRKKVMENGIDVLEQHEILELILFYAIPLKDTKIIAKVLLEKFRTISKVMEADVQELIKVDGIGKSSALLLNLIPQISKVFLQDRIRDKELIDSSSKAGKYCESLYLNKKNEEFYMICLNSQNKINFSGVIHKGSINQSAIYPRNIVEMALRHNAVSVIFSHNHPGGSLKPSNEDLQTTRKLKEIFQGLEIKVVDHIIVAFDGYFSFAENGFL